MINSLYIHIPFCSHICSYCDFCKVIYNSKWADKYLESLFFEFHKKNKNQKYQTIYIGGGTPSSLSEKQFALLLSFFSPYLAFNGEFSLEINPENFSLEKIKLCQKYHVNRVSIGVQSTKKENLEFLNRKHNFSDVKKIIFELKKVGINNISCDLIYGLPFQKIEDLKDDLDKFYSLDIDHFSTYSLIIEKNTFLYNNKVKELDDDILASMYNYILDYLRKRKYQRYEVSSFARNKKYSRHNLTYWCDLPYLGIGLGASSFDGINHYKNTLNFNKYIDHEYDNEEENCTKKEQIEYFLLTNLRLEEGFYLTDFKNRFQDDFLVLFKNRINKLKQNKLLDYDSNRIYLTDNGLLLMDRVLVELFTQL